MLEAENYGESGVESLAGMSFVRCYTGGTAKSLANRGKGMWLMR